MARHSAVARRLSALFVVVVVALGPALAARAQDGCGGFAPGLFSDDGVGWYVVALATFDDGAGEALYAAGQFTVAGGVPANRVARWDGSAWTPVGSGGGADDIVTDLVVFDDGTGPALYAGGYFRTMGGVPCERIAKWDGANWSPLGAGLGGGASAFAVFDDGRGPSLFVGGYFDTAGGVPCGRIARWDGAAWTTLGSGITGTFGLGWVNSLEVFDDGRGPALYAGGNIGTAGGVRVSNIARWDGSAWSDVAGGHDGFVYAMEVHDDGRGPALFAAGTFSSGSGSERIARWDGAAWSAVGGGFDFTVSGLTSYDDGTGSALYACGFFDRADGAPASRVARWDGVAWTPLGTGISQPGRPSTVYTLVPFDDGTGRALYAGGNFTRAGETAAECVARWDGREWSGLGERGLRGHPRALAEFDDGSGFALFVGGAFTSAGAIAAANVARWSGTSWSALGEGFDAAVNALALFDDGSGVALYAGGAFTASGSTPVRHVARWNGSSWEPVGAGLDGDVHALVVFDDGSGAALYAGGAFGQPFGSTSLQGVARFDGANWAALRTGIPGIVRALIEHDDGSSRALVVGGEFTVAGGVFASGAAAWDGSRFSALGTGPAGSVTALARVDSAAGKSLFAAGSFTSGSSLVPGILEWRNSTWTPRGFCDRPVLALAAYDSGAGPRLFAGGAFERIGIDSFERLAVLDGGVWTALGEGANADVTVMGASNVGGQNALFFGGRFTVVDGQVTAGLARWSDSCSACRRGSVNAGRGLVADVLFVNDSTGGPTRTVSLETHVPITIFMNGPPAASGASPFALYAWLARPDDGSWRTLPYGIGTTCLPTPLSPAGDAATPRAIFNNTGKRALGVPTHPSAPAPSIVVNLRHGTRRPVTFFLQGVIADPGSAGARRASASNGVLVVAR